MYTHLPNNSGGIQAGISNGQDIYFRVAFKPVSTILRDQKTVDKTGKDTNIKAQGRHDPCVLPRAVPIVEAMAALTILDYYLLSKSQLYLTKFVIHPCYVHFHYMEFEYPWISFHYL